MKEEKNEEVKEDEKVEEALDKIFEEDYLDVDTSDKKETDNKYSDDANDFHPLYNFNSFSPASDNDLKGEAKDESKDNSTENKSAESVNDEVLSFNEPEKPLEVTLEKTKKSNFKENFKSNKKYFFIGMIVVLLGLATLIIKFTVFKPSDIICTYKVSSDDFRIDDKYVIKDEKNISYVTGTYAYMAKTDAFKTEIDNIKAQKLPVIINSNGVIGFTHNYELGENYIRVYSYYDFSKMDFNYVDKNDASKTPLSYVTINSSTTPTSLKKELVKKGYNCVVQKEK